MQSSLESSKLRGWFLLIFRLPCSFRPGPGVEELTNLHASSLDLRCGTACLEEAVCVGSIIYPSPGHTCLPMNTSANLTLSSHTTPSANMQPSQMPILSPNQQSWRERVSWSTVIPLGTSILGWDPIGRTVQNPTLRLRRLAAGKNPSQEKTKYPVSLTTWRGRTKAPSDSSSSSRNLVPLPATSNCGGSNRNRLSKYGSNGVYSLVPRAPPDIEPTVSSEITQ